MVHRTKKSLERTENRQQQSEGATLLLESSSQRYPKQRQDDSQKHDTNLETPSSKTTETNLHSHVPDAGSSKTARNQQAVAGDHIPLDVNRNARASGDNAAVHDSPSGKVQAVGRRQDLPSRQPEQLNIWMQLRRMDAYVLQDLLNDKLSLSLCATGEARDNPIPLTTLSIGEKYSLCISGSAEQMQRNLGIPQITHVDLRCEHEVLPKLKKLVEKL